MNGIILRFFRSPLGIGLWGVCVFIATALILSGTLPFTAAIPFALLLGGVMTTVLLLSPVGARSVVAERDRDRADRDARVLGGVAAARKRLSLLRIENSRVKTELDRLVLAAGRYLETAVKGGARDPAAEDAVIGAVEVVNDYMQLADASSSIRRRGGESSGDADVIDRTVRALEASAREIEQRLDVSASAADRAAAREELR